MVLQYLFPSFIDNGVALYVVPGTLAAGGGCLDGRGMLYTVEFGSCGSISQAKIFEIALGREFEPRLGKFLELARIYHKHSPHKPNCHGVKKCLKNSI